MDITVILQNSVGLILPPIIDLINRYVADNRIKFWVSMVICILVAVVLNFNKVFTGDWTNFLAAVTLVFTEAQVVYHTYWKEATPRVAIFGKSILS